MPGGEGIFERSLLDEDQILEQENLVIDGVDISGRWNTFIKSRVQQDFDLSALNEVRSMVTGDSIDRCWQCGMCTASCTVNPLEEAFNPRKFIYLLRLGRMEDLRKKANVIWKCVGCYKCTHRCPKGVNTAEVIDAIASLLHHRYPEEFPKSEIVNREVYAQDIYNRGRTNVVKLRMDFLKKLGRQGELMSKENRAIAIKTALDGRALRSFFVGTPSNWRRFSQTLVKARQEGSERQ